MLYQEKPCDQEHKAVSSWGSSGGGSMKIMQNPNGHYFVDAKVNDQVMNFVIDTGASAVALPESQANSAGLQCQRSTMLQTGNGTTPACITSIASLKFGNFSFKDIEAIIAPNLNQPLLGMNVLKLFRIEQDNGELRLSKR